MARFCKYCGTQLEDGQVCSCPQAQAEAAQAAPQPQSGAYPPQQGGYIPPQGGYVPGGYQQPQGGYQQPQGGYQQPQSGYQQPQGGYQQPQGGYQQPQGGYQQPQGGYVPGGYQQPPYQQYQRRPRQPSALGTAFQNLFPFIGSYFRSPVEAARSALERKDCALALVLLGIQVLVSGLLGHALVRPLTSLFHVRIGAIIVRYLLCFLFGILTSAAAIAAFAALLLVVLKLTKTRRSFREVVTVCGVHSIYVTICLLAAVLFLYCFYPLGMLFFALAFLCWYVTGVLTVTELASPESKTKGTFWIFTILAYFVTVIAVTILAVIFVVILSVFSVSSSLNTLGGLFNSYGVNPFSSIVNEILSDLF